MTAKRLGTTCQRVFEQAYERVETTTKGRAAFVYYVDKNRIVLPQIVQDYCAKQTNELLSNKQEGVCLACTLDRAQWQGVVVAYRMIDPHTMGIVHAKPEPGPSRPSFQDRLFAAMLESGALDETDTEWKG